MIRYTLYALILILAAVALISPKTGPNALSAAPKPTPVGLQYDEISKTAIAPATAPPPGSFHTDFVAAMNGSGSQLPPGMDADTIATMKRMGIKIPNMAALGGGAPLRYAFYNGWIRVDDLLSKTAEIQKCNLHQFISLDLDKKTYRISNMSSGLGQASAGSMNGSERAQPGTAVMTVSQKAANLGPMTLDGIPTKGYNVTNSMTIAQATGSCQNANFSSTQTEYISAIHQPRTYCALYNPAINAGGRAAAGGCSPAVHYSGGAAVPSDRLVMYSRMQTSMGGGAAPAMVTQRGNVKWLYQADATALFTIPSDFTQQ